MYLQIYIYVKHIVYYIIYIYILYCIYSCRKLALFVSIQFAISARQMMSVIRAPPWSAKEHRLTPLTQSHPKWHPRRWHGGYSQDSYKMKHYGSKSYPTPFKPNHIQLHLNSVSPSCILLKSWRKNDTKREWKLCLPKSARLVVILRILIVAWIMQKRVCKNARFLATMTIMHAHFQFTVWSTPPFSRGSIHGGPESTSVLLQVSFLQPQSVLDRQLQQLE